MTFKASIDGVDEEFTTEEITINTRYAIYTLWTDGQDLVVQCNGDFKTINIESPGQLRLEMS